MATTVSAIARTSITWKWIKTNSLGDLTYPGSRKISFEFLSGSTSGLINRIASAQPTITAGSTLALALKDGYTDFDGTGVTASKINLIYIERVSGPLSAIIKFRGASFGPLMSTGNGHGIKLQNRFLWENDGTGIAIATSEDIFIDNTSGGTSLVINYIILGVGP